MATTDEVRLVVPALPEFLRLARVTAAGLASRLGFSFDEVEDLRLAIDEICHHLIGSGSDRESVEVRYVMEDNGLSVSGRLIRDGGDMSLTNGRASRPLAEFSEVILTALVDEHSVADGTFSLRKRRHGVSSP